MKPATRLWGQIWAAISLRRTDWAGIVYAGVGFGLIYAGLDQGNRVDWLNSEVVTGLLLAGGMLVVAFIIHEARAEYPLIHLSVLAGPISQWRLS